MEQRLLLRWVVDLLFNRGCLCDLQKSSSFLFSKMMELSSILVLKLSFPEDSI